ncbi:MAG: hypothetical protein A2177_09045 [Spirochaetes bacterium RBG_13_68_11]|nr:MAG: hypothetical protein A2177_09045 [Spirochaetes bacterium RBG_13_68_11]
MMRISVFARIGALTVLLFAGRIAGAETILPSVGIDRFGELSRLAASYGLALPTVSLPFSRSFESQVVESLAVTPTDSDVQAEAIALAESFRDSDVPFIGITLDVRYEQYVRPSDRPLSSSDFPFLLETVDPLGLIRFSFQLDNSTVLAITAVQQREYNSGTFDSNMFVPVSGNPIAIENNLVTEGYIQSTFGAFELTFGRQKVHIGPSPVNSLLVSQRIPFLDALDVKGHLGPLSMTLLISTLENREATPDVAPGDPAYAFGETTIISNTHYFEYSFGILRLGIGAHYIVVRPQNDFRMADFFPVISWHSTNLSPFNLSLIADFSVVPLEGLTIYGQGGLDDVNASVAGFSDEEIPTTPAFLVGATWHGRRERFLLNAWVETGYTHYLWGNYNDDAAMARAIYRMDLDGDDRAIPLTSPYGPGSVWAVASFAVATPWHLDAGMRILYVGRNPSANLTSTLYEGNPAIASAPLDHWLQCALELRWSPFDRLRLSAVPEFDVSGGKGWFALTLGGEVLFDKNVMIKGARNGNPRGD